MESITLAPWIFGLAVDVEEGPGIPYDFQRLGLS